MTYLLNYLLEAPVPLALERTVECEILKEYEFISPVLDLGCGEGMFANIFFKKAIEVGIDPNLNELKRAKQYNVHQELIQCYGNAIPKPDRYFNTIFSNSVLEHIENIDGVLKESFRLLNNNGTMYITVPTDQFEKYSLTYQILSLLGLKTLANFYSKKFFNPFWKHFHCYNIANWQELFKKHGFTIEKTIEYGSKRFCVLNSIMAPFCIFSFLVKKVANKWFITKLTRKFFVPIYAFIFNKTLIQNIGIEKGGLAFFKLRKI